MRRRPTNQNNRGPIPHWLLMVISAVVVLGFVRILVGQAHQGQPTRSADKRPSAPTTKAISRRQDRLENQLQRYFKTVTADGTTGVSFYSLGAKPHSAAAKDATAAQLYRTGRLTAEANAHTPIDSASTYKLFVAGYLFSLHHQGQYPWTAANREGLTRMIVYSENDFAEDFMDTNGLAGLNQFAQQQHAFTPMFIEGETARTTTASLTLILRHLAQQKKPFNHAADQQWLLGLMHKQFYRHGIPAGAQAAKSGTKVADKVGFLGDTNNDAGIVTLPDGEQYILVVTTHGPQPGGETGFKHIAQITQHVQGMVYNPKIIQDLNND